MYPAFFPGWKLLARLGMPILFRLQVRHDLEAGVYIATSPDLAGLVVESPSVEALIPSVYDCVDMLMEQELRRPLKHRPVAAWDGEVFAAA